MSQNPPNENQSPTQHEPIDQEDCMELKEDTELTAQPSESQQKALKDTSSIPDLPDEEMSHVTEKQLPLLEDTQLEVHEHSNVDAVELHAEVESRSETESKEHSDSSTRQPFLVCTEDLPLSSSTVLPSPFVQPVHIHEKSEEEDVLKEDTLSSRTFFSWTLIGLFIACILTIFWLSIAEPMLQNASKHVQHESFITFLNANSRALGMLLASVITLCAIAIPLTANNYTSKLIRLFTDSKVNRSMLALLVVANAYNLIVLSMFNLPGSYPMLSTAIAAALSVVCFTSVIPYAFYVFHFLQPNQIIYHIEKEALDTLREIQDKGDASDLEESRKSVVQNLKNLSNIALRSVERYDRDTALLSIEALRHIIYQYFELKQDMPAQWFRVSRMDFLSLSGEMRRRVERGKTFLEAEVMEEFALILGITFGRLRDMVRMIGRTLRQIGIRANERQLQTVLELTSLYFNTFLRAAISRKEPEAVYMIIYHYRRMAEEMLETNIQRPVRIAYYLSYYGHQSVRSGMVYIANLVSFDLAHITWQAFKKDAPSKQLLLNTFIAFDQHEHIASLQGVIKSRIKLAVQLHHLGCIEEYERLCASMETYDTHSIRFGIQEMCEVHYPMYWEVTDRNRHNDYIAPEKIESFNSVQKRLLGDTAPLFCNSSTLHDVTGQFEIQSLIET